MRPSLTLLLGLSGALLLGGCDRQSPAGSQAKQAWPGGQAPTGTLSLSFRGQPMPANAFTAPDGNKVTLADFRGKPLLVNLWATWCGPCVAEMPTLDAIAGERAAKLRIIVVSQDPQGKGVVNPFFAAHKFVHLQPYLDPQLGLGFALGSGMLPTTVLYDAQGKEVWRVTGAMDWSSPRANTLLSEVL